MRVLLLAPQNAPPPTLEEQRLWAELGSPRRTARLEEDHALALACICAMAVPWPPCWPAVRALPCIAGP